MAKATQKRTGRSRRNTGGKEKGLPIYFNTGHGALVILSLKPLRTCKFSHS